MTSQELKYSILSNAFTGKLCEHVETKDFGGVKTIELSETPFDVPETWVWSTLGLCCEMYTGNSISETVKAAKYAGLETGYDYIATKDVTFNQDICYDNGVRIPYNEGFKVAHKDAVLMCIEGGSAGRKIGILNRDVCFGNKLCSFHTQGIDNKYLYYYLQSWLFKELFSGNMTGIIGGVSIKKLKEIVIPVPPLAEQKRIVAKIEELLPLIDRYEQAWSKLEDFNKRFPVDMQKSILQMAIQGKLVPQLPEEGTGEELFQQIQAEKQALIKAGKIKKEKPLPEIVDEEKPYDIPSNWTWVRFGDLGSYKKGPFGSAITKSMFIPKGNGAVKVYEQKNAIQKDASLGDYYISREYFESKMKSFELFPGDIIVSCAGTIGETYVMPDEFEQGIINQALMKMKIFEPLYIPYFLVFFDFVLKKDARSSSKGSAIKNIPPFEILKNYLVPLPPLAEQKRIVAKLEEILPLCERLK